MASSNAFDHHVKTRRAWIQEYSLGSVIIGYSSILINFSGLDSGVAAAAMEMEKCHWLGSQEVSSHLTEDI